MKVRDLQAALAAGVTEFAGKVSKYQTESDHALASCTPVKYVLVSTEPHFEGTRYVKRTEDEVLEVATRYVELEKKHRRIVTLDEALATFAGSHKKVRGIFRNADFKPSTSGTVGVLVDVYYSGEKANRTVVRSADITCTWAEFEWLKAQAAYRYEQRRIDQADYRKENTARFERMYTRLVETHPELAEQYKSAFIGRYVYDANGNMVHHPLREEHFNTERWSSWFRVGASEVLAGLLEALLGEGK